MGDKNSITIDDYIAKHDGAVRERLMAILAAVRGAAPDAVERIAYGMPAFYVCGKPLAYFAAHKNHIGFYPIPESIEEFRAELSGFRCSKGGVQFPYHEPLPLNLITRMVRFRSQTCKANGNNG